MDEKPVIFEFENSIGRFVTGFVFGLLMGSLMSCWISLFSLIPILAIFRNIPNGIASYIIPVIFFLSLGLIIIPGIRNWIRSLTVDDEKLVLKTFTGRTRAILRDDIIESELGHDKIKLKSLTTTLTIYPKSLPWKERIIFKTLLLEWLTTTSPVDWQIYYQANSNAENELTVYRVEWKSFNHLRIEVDAVGVHYQKGRQHQTFDWSKIEVASLEFYRNQFSFWVDGYRAQIRFRKLNQEQIDDLFHILQKQLREHRIPYEVKMPV